MPSHSQVVVDRQRDVMYCLKHASATGTPRQPTVRGYVQGPCRAAGDPAHSGGIVRLMQVLHKVYGWSQLSRPTKVCDSVPL